MGKIKCLKCNTILESKWVHDFVGCSCDNQTFVDGGNDYLRYGGKDIKYIEVINEYKERETEG